SHQWPDATMPAMPAATAAPNAAAYRLAPLSAAATPGITVATASCSKARIEISASIPIDEAAYGALSTPGGRRSRVASGLVMDRDWTVDDDGHKLATSTQLEVKRRFHGGQRGAPQRGRNGRAQRRGGVDAAFLRAQRPHQELPQRRQPAPLPP